MAITKDQYRALIAERHVQMYALKAGVPVPGGTPAAAGAEQQPRPEVHKVMVEEAFALADAFIAGCEARNVKPWERENL